MKRLVTEERAFCDLHPDQYQEWSCEVCGNDCCSLDRIIHIDVRTPVSGKFGLDLCEPCFRANSLPTLIGTYLQPQPLNHIILGVYWGELTL